MRPPAAQLANVWVKLANLRSLRRANIGVVDDDEFEARFGTELAGLPDVQAVAHASRSLIEQANGLLARGKEWVLNEKGIVRRADLAEAGADLLAATTNDELLGVARAIRERYESDVR